MGLAVMRQFGMSANLMSLGGLAIAIGMLVDGAVVVIENVVERLADPAHKIVRPTPSRLLLRVPHRGSSDA